MLPKWSPKPPEWKDDTYQLLQENTPNKISQVTLANLVKNSNKFPIKFPVETGRCHTLQKIVSPEILERNINSTYPLIHEKALELCAKFILFKRTHGSPVEKKLYATMSLLGFIQRLLTKRAVMFAGIYDHYVLLNGEEGFYKWETIGTKSEDKPLVLKDCLSYDELKLSVFLSISSYTYFVNIGNRRNMAVFDQNRQEIEDEAVIIGLIGTRLMKERVMEFEELVFTPQQNTRENGYGTTVTTPNMHNLISNFYEETSRDYQETVDLKKEVPGRFRDLKNTYIFDDVTYYKRMTFTIDTMLIEADYRAGVKGVTAYLHVVGLGLGVWRISAHQDQVYMEICAKRIEKIGKNLKNISDICFSYINQPTCGDYKNGDLFPIPEHPLNGIKIHIFNREPHKKLMDNDKGKLLVVSYAWDGNALPGNEYWISQLGNSSDSAAASSTQITELHNPQINPKVCSNSLKIVTEQGVVGFKEYQKVIKSKRKEKKS